MPQIKTLVSDTLREDNPVWGHEKLTHHFPLFHPWQHATTHVGSVRGQRTTNVSTANLAGCFMTTSVWVSAVFHRPCAGFPTVFRWTWTFFDHRLSYVFFCRHWWVWNRAGSLSFQHLLSQHGWILWMQRYAGLCIRWFYLNVPVSQSFSFFVCVQGATRHVWDAWEAVLLVVRNVLAATD